MCATLPFATGSPASSTMATSGQIAWPLLPARSNAYPGGGHVMGMHSVIPYDVKTAAPGNTSRSWIATDGSNGPAAFATNLTFVFGIPVVIAKALFTISMCIVGAP